MGIVATKPLSVRAGSCWQEAVRTAIRDPVELCRAVGLPERFERAAACAAESFSVFAPRAFVAKMTPGDAGDPLLRQVLPLADELESPTEFGKDPVGDMAALEAPGLLKKYAGRALLITTGACAVHGRYCFRREFPYSDAPHSVDDWQPALDQIADDPSIEEVLLSGGDPLMLIDSRLAELAQRIGRIAHVRRLRIHTRLPIMIPERVTDELIAWLRGTRLTPWVVVHANHSRELDESVAFALTKLVDAGIPVLNQAVLLRGVNDNIDALTDLSRRLVDLRVTPYYLHQLDRVSGAAHFEVPIDRGIDLIRELRTRLPGYAVPRYVQESAGDSAKRILA